MRLNPKYSAPHFGQKERWAYVSVEMLFSILDFQFSILDFGIITRSTQREVYYSPLTPTTFAATEPATDAATATVVSHF